MVMVSNSFALLSVGLLVRSASQTGAIECEPAPRRGIYIDRLRATSDTSRLAATVSLYKNDDEILDRKDVAIHLESGTLVEGYEAPDGTTIFSSGLGAPLDFSQYQYVLDVDSQEYKGSVVDTETGEKVSFALPDLKPNEFGQEVVLWFVSLQLQRTFVFYEYIFFNEETLQRLAGNAPQVVVVIAPIPGTEGTVAYLAYENFLDYITLGGEEAFDGRMTVFEDLRMAILPHNTCSATTMYYKTDRVELRDLGPGHFSVDEMAVAAEGSADFVYKADHTIVMGRPSEYVICKTNIWTGERQNFPLNIDQVLALFEQTDSPQGANSGKTSKASRTSGATAFLSSLLVTALFIYTIL